MLVDDHAILRDGLRALLEQQDDMCVVAEAGDGREAVRLVGESEPAVVVIDIGMPELNGVEATKRIVAGHPDIKVIALSMHGDRRFVVEMLRAGVSGYVLKDSAAQELVQGIRQAIAGKVFLGTGVADVVVDEVLLRLEREDTTAQTLTKREREVVQLLAEGASTREIAGKLFISVKTVETHRANIMRKLGLRSVAELTKYAIREGLTSVE
ncbi:MAG: response regulator transcription factor [Deltaproteobacteria bacterium]|nr:response regulator transcription factor [Deltaproteobacteria bacterium]